jgi:hypothetical protein
MATITRNTNPHPTLAAATTDMDAGRYLEDKPHPAKYKRATIRLAPDERPSTSGPARGFLKSVCICRPASARAAPAVIHVKALVIRKFQIISVQTLSEFGEKSISTTFFNGICTEPVPMSTMNKSRSKPVNKTHEKPVFRSIYTGLKATQ